MTSHPITAAGRDLGITGARRGAMGHRGVALVAFSADLPPRVGAAVLRSGRATAGGWPLLPASAPQWPPVSLRGT